MIKNQKKWLKPKKKNLSIRRNYKNFLKNFLENWEWLKPKKKKSIDSTYDRAIKIFLEIFIQILHNLKDVQERRNGRRIVTKI